MICDNCGTSNPDQSRFCSFCGRTLQSTTPKNDSTSSPIPSNGPVVGMRPLFNQVPPTVPQTQPIPVVHRTATSPDVPAAIPTDSPAVTPNKASTTPPEHHHEGPPNNNVIAGFRQIQSNTNSSTYPESNSLHTIPPNLPPALNVNTPQQSNICPVCHSLNPTGAAFCGVCGNKILNNAGPTPQQGRVCPRCHVINNANAKFCKNCGETLPPITSKSSYTTKARTMNRSLATSNTRNLWVGLAGLGAILTLLCFFLPNQIFKFANPMAWLTGGPEQISISISGMQLMTLSSPTVKGLGGLGEASENLYDELDMGLLMLDSADPAMKRSVTLTRILIGLLLCCSIATIITTIQAYRTSETSISKLMMILGGISIILLLISTFVGNASFRTGNTDMDLLLNTTISISNGLGFWGMLVGFASFSLGGFLRNQ